MLRTCFAAKEVDLEDYNPGNASDKSCILAIAAKM